MTESLFEALSMLDVVHKNQILLVLNFFAVFKNKHVGWSDSDEIEGNLRRIYRYLMSEILRVRFWSWSEVVICSIDRIRILRLARFNLIIEMGLNLFMLLNLFIPLNLFTDINKFNAVIKKL